MLSLFEIKKILSPQTDYLPEDDFRIIQSWAEYDETSSKTPEERTLNYLCYELEVMNPDTGEITHFFLKQSNLLESAVYQPVQNKVWL